MHNHWRSSLAAAVLLAVVMTGCGQGKPLSGGATTADPVQSVQPDATSTTAEQSQKKLSLPVKTYYSNSGFDKLVEKQSMIEVDTDADKYKAVFEQLRTAPDEQTVSLAKHITVKSVQLQGSLLTVDMTIPGEARLGAGGEEMLLQAFAQAAFQFKEINALQLLVDGQKVDSLMGHMELQHPIKR
ncbi:GerMN domain-containing protein [Paenibacillus sp. YYML68]|uniref:GerMN domain-containing protein n=1 Tax=Paenibacillus sp. YYML68 TaxID=2909250 RepID=UPI0024908077|nr:GerMN domain-containing protein [Paenibacillus sp. YYML68]